MAAEIKLRDLGEIGAVKGLQIWRVKDIDLEDVPKGQYGAFYSGDCYVLLNTRSYGSWDIHYWLGKGCSADEIGVAAAMAVHIDNALGGNPVVHRELEGHESPLFLSYFTTHAGSWSQGITILSGGYDGAYHFSPEMLTNWKPQLFHCKGKRNIRCCQVDCKKESLNLGDVFILDLGKDIYVWMPPKSGRLERIKAMARAKNMAEVDRQKLSKVHLVDDDWQTNSGFWSHFGGKETLGMIKGAKDDDDEDYWKINNAVSLWRVSDSTGEMVINQVAEQDLKTSMLDSKDAFILDAGKGGVFVWIGKNCTVDEREKAMETGAKYLHKRKLPDYTVLIRVLETAEPTTFTQWFGDWENTKSKKSYEPRLYQVSDETGKLVVEEIEQFDQLCLDGDDVMVLDALNTIYVWVGADANKNERDSAHETAKKFLNDSRLPRGKKPEIEIIGQGHEPVSFKKFFPEWDDKLFKQDARSVSNMRKLLFQ